MFVCLGLDRFGGIARRISILSGELTGDANEIYVLSLSGGNTSYPFNKSVHIINPNRSSIGLKYLEKIRRIYAIRKAVKKYRIDIVIPFEYYNIMYAVLATIGMSVKIIGAEANDPTLLDSRLLLKIIRILMYRDRKLKWLVCQTYDGKNYYPDKIRDKCVVICNPVTGTLPTRYEGERTKRIVTFSRIEKQKNIPLLIEAFREFRRDHDDYTLEIYGEGSLKEQLQEEVKNGESADAILFFPFRKDIHQTILDAKMFVIASDYEGLSNSMIEAMACGLPVIATDCPCGGARMLIRDGINGILVSVGDKSHMAEAMTRLADDNDLSERISRHAEKIRDQLSAQKISEQWRALLA